MLFGEVARSFDDDGDDVRAAVAVDAEWDTVAGKLERRAGLGAGRDFHGDFAVNGLNVDFATEGGVDHADGLLGKDESAFAS